MARPGTPMPAHRVLCAARTCRRAAQLLRGAALRLDQQLHGAVLLVGAGGRRNRKEARLAVLAKLGLHGATGGCPVSCPPGLVESSLPCAVSTVGTARTARNEVRHMLAQAPNAFPPLLAWINWPALV